MVLLFHKGPPDSPDSYRGGIRGPFGKIRYAELRFFSLRFFRSLFCFGIKIPRSVGFVFHKGRLVSSAGRDRFRFAKTNLIFKFSNFQIKKIFPLRFFHPFILSSLLSHQIHLTKTVSEH